MALLRGGRAERAGPRRAGRRVACAHSPAAAEMCEGEVVGRRASWPQLVGGVPAGLGRSLECGRAADIYSDETWNPKKRLTLSQ